MAETKDERPPWVCECGTVLPRVKALYEELQERIGHNDALLSALTVERRKRTAERNANDERRKSSPLASAAEEVFGYWRERCAPRAREFSGKRLAAVLGRLEAGHSVEDLKLAIDGAAARPFVTTKGRTARGEPEQRNVELELICRDESNVHRFASYAAAAEAASGTSSSSIASKDDPGGAPPSLAPPEPLTDRRMLDRLHELRGWQPATVRALGIGIEGDRVVFPVRDGDDNLVGLVRYSPNPAKRNGTKALAEGDRNLFPAPEVYGEGGQVWLVEGESDAVSARSVGLDAVAVPGVATWKIGWVERFARFGRVLVAFDCDEAGRTEAAKRVEALRGTTRALLVDIEPGRHDGYDVTDMVLELGARAGEQLRLRSRAGAGNALLPRRAAEPPEDLILRALRGKGSQIKGTRPQWTAQCPAHEDRHASLSVKVQPDGTILVTCHTGCPPDAVIGALGLTWSELFAETLW